MFFPFWMILLLIFEFFCKILCAIYICDLWDFSIDESARLWNDINYLIILYFCEGTKKWRSVVGPPRGTESLREAQGGKEEVGVGKTRKLGRTGWRILRKRSSRGSIYKCFTLAISGLWIWILWHINPKIHLVKYPRYLAQSQFLAPWFCLTSHY